MARRLTMEDAAYCAAAWASGETQASLAKTFGFSKSSPVCLAIGAFLDAFAGVRVRGVNGPKFIVGIQGDDRRKLVPLALALFQDHRRRAGSA